MASNDDDGGIIREVPMLPVRVTRSCPECRVGLMKYFGWSSGQGNVYYAHDCTDCNYRAHYSQSYPHIGYRPRPL